MKNTNRFTPDLYTEAQWQWIEAKYREGYYISQLAEFLGISRGFRAAFSSGAESAR